MIIATFNHGFNVTVNDSGSNPVWSFSTASGEYFSKDLPAGSYSVEVGPGRTLTANVSADDMVGVVGGYSDFTLQTAHRSR